MSIFVNAAFTPDDVDVMRAAVNSWCQEQKIDIDSNEARSVASTALDLFQLGHNTSDQLLIALRDRSHI